MEENKVETIETTEEMGTEDGMEKTFDYEGILGAGMIAVGSIAVFEGGKWVVKKLKEPAKKLFNGIKSKFKKDKDQPVDDKSEPNHEELNSEADEKAEDKKSDNKAK